MFDVSHEESFSNLSKWHTDVLSYCKSNSDKFAIILVGIRYSLANRSSSGGGGSGFKCRSPSGFSPINNELIEQFQAEKPYVVGYCEVNLDDESNLTEPFVMLVEHMNKMAESRGSKYFGSYFGASEAAAAMTIGADEKIKLEKDDDDGQKRSSSLKKKCCTIL
jgi:hypothetical protein